MSVLQLIASRNYIVVNKHLIKIIGLEETIVLGELASEYDYWLEKEQLEDGYFYSTIDNIESNTSLNEYKQRKAFKSLQDKDIVDVKIKGIPAKRYIKINEEQVLKLLNINNLNNLRPSSLKIKELDVKRLKGNYNILNKNIKNNKYNIYGEFKNVKLTDEEYKKLEEKNLLPYIEKLSSYIASKGKRYKSHYATILNWSRKEVKNNVKEDIIPDWFNKDFSDQKLMTDKESSNEMENILKEMESDY